MTKRIIGFFPLLFLVLGPAVGSVFAVDKSQVVLARNPKAIDGRNQADLKETIRLFDSALLALTKKETAADAWKALGLLPEDVVAVKINCNTWTINVSPHPELVAALCRSLKTVVPVNQIIIYDNESSALEKNGFLINRSADGVRYSGTDRGDGFDPHQRLTKIITHSASKIINLASLKCADEDFIVSLLFKNHIGSLVPDDMSKCHDDQGFLAGVCARDSIKKKTILNIITGLRGTYRRSVPWFWAGVILGTDPVAVDATAIGVMNEKRALEKLAALPIPEYLEIAEKKYNLGTLDEARIERIKIEIPPVSSFREEP